MKEFNYKKKYGQNFLVDQNILNKIIDNLTINSNDLIIEIGPGSGNLTKKLLKFGAKVLAYEIDLEVKTELEKIKSNNLKVIYKDILTANIKDNIKDFDYKNIYIIGNLPYYITTPIIEKLTKENLNPKEMYFMVQKEVADRLTSKPCSKKYGYITVYLNYYYKLDKLFDVNRKSFYPIPNVDSSIIKLTLINKYNSQNEELFFLIIKEAFIHKRKTLLNNLKKYDQLIIKELLIKHNYSLLARSEELPIEFFIELSNAL